MLVKSLDRKRSGLGWLCLAIAFLVAGLAFHLLSLVFPSTEAVRLRNALVMEPEPATNFGWAPRQRPAGFHVETLAPDPRFVAVVKSIGADRGPDFARMLAIAGHLTENSRDTGPIQSETWDSYLQIREGGGYCSDFTQVFLALAHAAGLSAREWGFSFDGFGGDGHAVIEAWDRQRGQWVFLDIYNNFHVVARDSGEPLDALQWRQAVMAGGEGVRIVPNGPGRPGWEKPEGVWEYYGRGVHGWYLWLANDVESYDRNPLVSLAGQTSRSLEQVAAILVGAHPHILVLGTPENRAAFERMRVLRRQLLVEIPLLAVAGLCLPWLCLAWWRRRRQPADAGGVPRILMVGPVPPPSGGMAAQCRLLSDLLRADGNDVEVVETNAPIRPAWAGRLRGLRAVFRLLPYLGRLWAGLSRCHVVHIFANSGWAWYLMAMPALALARLRRVPVVLNYHGGEAAAFFTSAPFWVRRSLGLADALVVPSGYLERFFKDLGFSPRVIPNVVDLARFRPRERTHPADYPQVLVTRNLEPIYDIPTAIRAFAIIAERFPEARLTVAGSGPEADALKCLVAEMGLSDRVAFTGRIDNQDIHTLYAGGDLLLNPSTADNMPISLLEAYASGVPVVSTNVGGIPWLVQDGYNGLLVSPGEPGAMADAALAILDDPQFASRLAANGLRTVAACGWPQVRRLWLDVYAGLVPEGKVACHA